MKLDLKNVVLADNYLECFGEFDIEDLICKKYCALCLRCIIERDKIFEMDLFDEVLESGLMDSVMQ